MFERLKLYRFAPPALLLCVLLVAGACGGQGSGEPADAGDEGEDGGVRVVATFSIFGDLVENVGGDEVELTTLVGPNEDSHNFDPSPSDGAEVSESDILFENGLEFETWIDDIYESSGSDAQRVVLGEDDRIELIEAGEGHEEEHNGHDHGDEEEHNGGDHGHEEDHNGHDDHDHGEYDPHVWHDAGNVVAMVESIRDALAEEDPENAEVYESNAEEYIAELEDLDSEIAETVDLIPEDQRRLVTAHDTFAYFAERYDFEVIGTALESVSTEASDPSAGQIASLAEDIRKTGVPAIFPENVSNPAVMEQVAAEADVELADPLYTDALGEPGGEAGTYVEMLRYNSETMAESLL